MNIFYTGDSWTHEQIEGKNTIFLAGPSKSPNGSCKSYRKELVELIKEKVNNCVIFYPEFEDDSIIKNVGNMREWEKSAMNASKIIIIGLNTNEANPGFTTRTEIGYLVGTRKNLIVYAPPDSFKIKYQVDLADDHNIAVCETIKEIIDEIKQLLLDTVAIIDVSPNYVTVFANDCDPVVFKEVIMQQELLNPNLYLKTIITNGDHLNFKVLADLGYKVCNYNQKSGILLFSKANHNLQQNLNEVWVVCIGIINVCLLIYLLFF